MANLSTNRLRGSSTSTGLLLLVAVHVIGSIAAALAAATAAALATAAAALTLVLLTGLSWLIALSLLVALIRIFAGLILILVGTLRAICHLELLVVELPGHIKTAHVAQM